jgi:hypothetical protein
MIVRNLHVGSLIDGHWYSLMSHLRLKPFASPSTRLRAWRGFVPLRGKSNNLTHLPRVNSPTRSVINKERDAVRACGSQHMVRVKEELGDCKVIGNEGCRLRGDDFGHDLVKENAQVGHTRGSSMGTRVLYL